MKKELLIVILVIFGIIGISILLKYVIFKNYNENLSNENKDVICRNFCEKQGFSFGRCGCDCSDGDRKITIEELEKNNLKEKVQESCKIKPRNGAELPCAWTCCCR